MILLVAVRGEMAVRCHAVMVAAVVVVVVVAASARDAVTSAVCVRTRQRATRRRATNRVDPLMHD